MALSSPTTDEVRLIIATDLTDAQVTAVISDAALMADQCSGIASLSTALQTSIVKWITAHLIATQTGDGQRTQRKLGDAQDVWAKPVMGEGLKGTSYGQQAIALDPTGCLAVIGRRKPYLCALT